MSDRLTLSGIRESAMNPPAGTAAGYQDLLWDQMVQANTDAYNAYMQSLRDTANRAMERSGWYNVGRMMIPQDAGDVALAAAMGPGMGRLARAALAGLGGLTTQPSDAEGAILPRSWFESMLRSRLPAVRREGQRGLDTLADASRGINIDAVRWTDPVDQNRMFAELSGDTWQHGWLPYGNNRWMGMLDPNREIDYSVFDAAVAAGRPQRFSTENLVHDPVYFEAADRALNTGQRGRMTRFDPNLVGGYYELGGNGDIVVGLGDSFMFSPRSTFRHERQHSVIDRAGLSYPGATVEEMRLDSPRNVYLDYLRRANNQELLAAERMYHAEPGEWLSRLAERTDNPTAWIGQASLLDDPYTAMPDFRIR